MTIVNSESFKAWHFQLTTVYLSTMSRISCSSFSSGFSIAHYEFELPEGRTVARLKWFGVCADSSGSVTLASIAIHPTLVKNLPCNTTFLGTLSNNEREITGRVYLVDRETYAVLGFSYSREENEGW